jgi:hypothetical protein
VSEEERAKQLREVAMYNGTIRTADVCRACGGNHRITECPNRVQTWKPLVCTRCGGSHLVQDCRLDNAAAKVYLEEYNSFMAEITDTKSSDQSSLPANAAVPAQNAAPAPEGALLPFPAGFPPPPMGVVGTPGVYAPPHGMLMDPYGRPLNLQSLPPPPPGYEYFFEQRVHYTGPPGPAPHAYENMSSQLYDNTSQVYDGQAQMTAHAGQPPFGKPFTNNQQNMGEESGGANSGQNPYAGSSDAKSGPTQQAGPGTTASGSLFAPPGLVQNAYQQQVQVNTQTPGNPYAQAHVLHQVNHMSGLQQQPQTMQGMPAGQQPWQMAFGGQYGYM